MSINQYSSEATTTTQWWNMNRNTHREHQRPLVMENPSLSSLDEDYVDDDDNVNIPSGQVEEEKEAMFEKPLTPSDVGKLNRLVIPKQHAEKYFPLGGSSGESASGVSLSFEDESGKCWRFRYSYWNSSQSYVLTKGWSRYVKDKRLLPGDVVFFHRHRSDSSRLFINWRRRPTSAATPHHANTNIINNNNNNVGVGVGVEWTRGFYSAHPYPTHPHHPSPYQPHSLHAPGGGLEADQNKATSSAVGNSSRSRVLRLFGVNMEWQPDQSGSSIPECSYVSSTQGTATQQHHQLYGHYYHQPSYSSNHMDVNQMRNRRG